jgi:hypothetical protein
MGKNVVSEREAEHEKNVVRETANRNGAKRTTLPRSSCASRNEHEHERNVQTLHAMAGAHTHTARYVRHRHAII